MKVEDPRVGRCIGTLLVCRGRSAEPSLVIGLERAAPRRLGPADAGLDASVIRRRRGQVPDALSVADESNIAFDAFPQAAVVHRTGEISRHDDLERIAVAGSGGSVSPR